MVPVEHTNSLALLTFCQDGTWIRQDVRDSLGACRGLSHRVEHGQAIGEWENRVPTVAIVRLFLFADPIILS